MMVAAGFGICFIPEFSPTIPGVLTRLVADPEVVREVSLVSIAGRRFSPAVAAFARAIRGYRWPEAQETPALPVGRGETPRLRAPCPAARPPPRKSPLPSSRLAAAH